MTAVNDQIAEGAHTGTITHAASGGGYNGVSIASVTANVTDNDTAGVTVTESGGSTTASWGRTGYCSRSTPSSVVNFSSS